MIESSLTIRKECPEDAVAVREVLLQAFGHAVEADLVEELRATGGLTYSWIGERNGEVIGYIAFSPIRVESNPMESLIIGLAPVAIHPLVQREGFGSHLITGALEQLRDQLVAAVVVLGEPEYYHRFGFCPAQEFGLQCLFDAPPEAFMAIELTPDALQSLDGKVHYHRAFDQFLNPTARSANDSP